MNNENLQQIIDLNNLGNQMRQAGQYTQAIEYFDQAINLTPDQNMFVYYNKGLACDALNQYPESIKCYDKVINLIRNTSDQSPIMQASSQSIQQIDGSLLMQGTGFRNPLMLKAQALKKLNKYDDAHNCCNEAIELNSNNLDAYLYKGILCSTHQQYKEAMAYYDQVVKIYTHNDNELAPKLRIPASLPIYQEAVASCEKILHMLTMLPMLPNKDPIVSVYLFKIDMLSLLEKHFEVLACYDTLMQISPETKPEQLNSKAVFLNSLYRYEEAKNCCVEALAINPNYHLALYLNKGIALKGLNQYEEALECYDLVIQRDESFQDAYYNKGNLLCKMQRYEAALQCYNKAIELNPNDLGVLENKATVLDSLHKYPEALALYDQVIQMHQNPNNINTVTSFDRLLNNRQKTFLKCHLNTEYQSTQALYEDDHNIDLPGSSDHQVDSHE